MSVAHCKPHEPLPNLRIATAHDSGGGIFRILPVNSLMGCLCNLVDRKKKKKKQVWRSIVAISGKSRD